MPNNLREESLLADDSHDDISWKQWSLYTRQLYMMLKRSANFLSLLKLFFGTAEMSDLQVAVGNKIIISVYGEVVGKIAERVKSVKMGNAVIINFREMPIEGRAKIRYVGAWAVPISCEFKLITYDISDSNNPGFSEEVSGNEWCAS